MTAMDLIIGTRHITPDAITRTTTGVGAVQRWGADQPRVHWDDGLWRRRTVAQGAVRPDGVGVALPFLDQDLCFALGVEDLAVEEFIHCPAGDLYCKSAEEGRSGR